MPCIISGNNRGDLSVFYVLCTSESMKGAKISALNQAMEKCIEQLQHEKNWKPKLKIAVLEFNSGCKWITSDVLTDPKDFTFEHLKARGLADVGAALKELNNKLSRHARHTFLKPRTPVSQPVIIFVTDGPATDDYVKALEKIRKNRRFARAIKIGFAIGNDADVKMLASIVGSSEAVIKVTDLDFFIELMRYISDEVPLRFSQSTTSGTDNIGKNIVKYINAYSVKVCPYCGKEWIEKDQYCRYCGAEKRSAKLALDSFACIYGPMSIERRHRCKNCGYTWTTEFIDEKYCPMCGGDAPIVFDSNYDTVGVEVEVSDRSGAEERGSYISFFKKNLDKQKESHGQNKNNKEQRNILADLREKEAWEGELEPLPYRNYGSVSDMIPTLQYDYSPWFASRHYDGHEDETGVVWLLLEKEADLAGTIDKLLKIEDLSKFYDELHICYKEILHIRVHSCQVVNDLKERQMEIFEKCRERNIRIVIGTNPCEYYDFISGDIFKVEVGYTRPGMADDAATYCNLVLNRIAKCQ